MSAPPTTELPAFFDALGYEPGDLIELRPIPHDGERPEGRGWFVPSQLAAMNGGITRLNQRQSIYFGVNPRTHSGGGSRADVACCRCVFADFDGVTLDDAMQRIEAAGLPHPTVIVESGGGWHTYWTLADPIDCDTFERIQRGLIAVLDSDKRVCDAPRIMRLPGTVNRKPERNGASCRVVELNRERHDVESIIMRLPEPEPAAVESPTAATTSDDKRVERARRYISKLPPAISGQGGHDATFHTACELFRFGLDDADARRLLTDYNARCEPPWGDRELDHKIENAKAEVAKKGEFGSRLADDRAGAQHYAQRTSDDGKPEVVLPGGNVPINEASAQLGRLLAASGDYYVRGGAAVRLARDEQGSPMLNVVKPASLASAFENVALLRRWGRRGDLVPTTCGEPAARLVLHSEAFTNELPIVRVVTRCPVLVERTDGTLAEIVGYDRESGVLAGGDPVDDLTLEDARELLLDLLADFNFPSEADKSRALAAVITPGLVFGGLLRGRAPVDLGEADDSQAGKGYRNKLTAAIYRHSVSTIVQRKGGVGSLDESFNSALVRGAPFIAIDNVRGKVDSQAIESFLTEDRYSARVPYAGAVEIDPRRTVVMITSNRAEITVDLANRCSCARILKQPPGFQFRQFAEGDLLDHVRQHHGRYLGAVFTLVRAWHAAGKPHTAETRHDFRAWVQPLDWIVQNLLGCAPLILGHRETQRRMTSPALSWLRDVTLAVVRAQRTNACLRAHDLLDIIAADGTVKIPGVDGEGMVVDDDKTREKAMRGIGRRIGQCFHDSEQIDVDGFTIERQTTTDPASRLVKTYRFRTARSPHFPAIPPKSPPHQNTGFPHSPHGVHTFCTQSEKQPEYGSMGQCGECGECGGDVQEDITQPTVWKQEITL